jgi:hypothetical protein
MVMIQYGCRVRSFRYPESDPVTNDFGEHDLRDMHLAPSALCEAISLLNFGVLRALRFEVATTLGTLGVRLIELPPPSSARRLRRLDHDSSLSGAYSTWRSDYAKRATGEGPGLFRTAALARQARLLSGK